MTVVFNYEGPTHRPGSALYLALLKLALGQALGKRPDLRSLDSIATSLREKAVAGEKARIPFQNRFLRGDIKRLRRLQEKRLRATVRYVAEYVPFYRRLFRETKIWPEDIKTAEDLKRLPPTRKEHIKNDCQSFFSRHPAAQEISSEGITSGTTGKPLSIYSTRYESEYRTLMRAIGSLVLGATSPRDIVQLHLGAGRAAGTARSAQAVYGKIGALVFNYGYLGTLEEHIASVFEERHIPGKKTRVSVLMANPSYLLAMTARSKALGYNLRETGVEMIGTGAQHVSDYCKARIKDTWGQEVFEGYGLTETAPCSATDCREHKSLHFRSVFGYPEVVDPSGGDPVPLGEEGVLLITTFYPAREAMPLLRYWTNDKVIMDPETCPCGVPSDMILDVIGRLDNTLKVGGSLIFPEGVAQIIAGHAELAAPPRFNFEVVEVEHGEQLRVKVEAGTKLRKPAKVKIQEELEQEMRDLAQIFRTAAAECVVEVVPPGGVANPTSCKMTG